jgi:hypothetical protein
MKPLVAVLLVALLVALAVLAQVPAIFVGGLYLLTNALPAPAPASAREPDRAAIRLSQERAIAFLKAQYDLAVGLLRESPAIGEHNFYLTNDNALAAYVLDLAGEKELAATLRASLKMYGWETNGFVEAAWGVPITWPPNHHLDVVVRQVGEDRVLQETHDGPGYFYDWSAYSNLAFMAVVNEENRGYHESAGRLFEMQMGKFDGIGWQDKAYWDRNEVYETLGLAWGLYAGALTGRPAPPALLQSILSRQGPSGGFHTHFSASEDRLADPNVETTCLALLALHAYMR